MLFTKKMKQLDPRKKNLKIATHNFQKNVEHFKDLQSAFANLLQVSSSTVSRWETGAHPPTSRHRIVLTATDRMHQSVFTSRGLPE